MNVGHSVANQVSASASRVGWAGSGSRRIHQSRLPYRCKMAQASRRRRKRGAELVTVVAVAGQRPGQEPGIAFGGEHPDGDELVLALTAHGGLEVDQPGQPPGPARAFGGQQVLAHDLGVQQHRRTGRQRDRSRNPGIWSAHAAGRPRARCSLTHCARCRATKAGQSAGHQWSNRGRRQPVQRRDRLAQLGGQPVAVRAGTWSHTVSSGTPGRRLISTYPHPSWSPAACTRGVGIGSRPARRPAPPPPPAIPATPPPAGTASKPGHRSRRPAASLPRTWPAGPLNAQALAQPLDTRPQRRLIPADRREGFLSRCWRQHGHGSRTYPPRQPAAIGPTPCSPARALR